MPRSLSAFFSAIRRNRLHCADSLDSRVRLVMSASIWWLQGSVIWWKQVWMQSFTLPVYKAAELQVAAQIHRAVIISQLWHSAVVLVLGGHLGSLCWTCISKAGVTWGVLLKLPWTDEKMLLRIVGWFGLGPQRSSCSTSLPWTPSMRPGSSNLTLDTSRDGAASLINLCQGLTILPGRNFFLISNIIHSVSVKPHPFSWASRPL